MLQRPKIAAPAPSLLADESWSGYRPAGQSTTEAFARKTAGLLLARPWIDRVAATALRRYFFPLSRLWAAASIADGSPERFFSQIPMSARHGSRDRVLQTLARFEQARAKSVAVDATWERVFFGETDTGADDRIATEAARLELRHALGATRRDFYFLTWNDVPRVRYNAPSREEVEAVYGPALNDFEPFVAPPDPMPRVETSRRVVANKGTDFWLRFKAPSERLGDSVYARVHEPEGVGDPPTIIFGHGVCVDFDHWRGLIDEAQALRARGIRVIRPEAPWHGRRTPAGCYGGENLVATFPAGPLDMSTGAAREWAVLADWARSTSSGRLAFGGSSLGALTAQFAADCAMAWPQRLRPDALFLITHCRGLLDAMYDGQLVNVWGDANLFESGGWNKDRLRAYLNLLNAKDTTCVRAENIVSVLGRFDAVTPFDSGRALVQSWGVRDENLFIWDRGHFSVPMTMSRNHKPIERLCRIMGVPLERNQ